MKNGPTGSVDGPPEVLGKEEKTGKVDEPAVVEVEDRVGCAEDRCELDKVGEPHDAVEVGVWVGKVRDRHWNNRQS